MTRILKYSRMTIALGVMTLVGLAICFHALADVSRGGEDLALEWTALRVTALLVVMFVAPDVRHPASRPDGVASTGKEIEHG